MLSMLQLVTCARLSGRWATCRIEQARSASSKVIRQLTDHAFELCRLPAPVPLPVRVPRLNAIVVLPALMLALLSASADSAVREGGFASIADGRLVDVQVQVNGRTAPLYIPRDGSARRYFEAFKGRNYSLVVSNNTGRRIGVLIAVDGINVVNGERSQLRSNESMYVLGPWERTVIQGWRSSLHDIRRFVFVDEHRSYAERTGQANGDMGWVRVLAFNEQRPWFDLSPGRIKDGERGRYDNDEVTPFGSGLDKREEAPQAQSRDQAAPEAREGETAEPNSKTWGQNKSMYRGDGAVQPQASVPGTGWGDQRHDPVRRVNFDPERHATDQIVLRYEYASGLRALGIFPRQFRDRIWERENGELGFAQPPRW